MLGLIRNQGDAERVRALEQTYLEIRRKSGDGAAPSRCVVTYFAQGARRTSMAVRLRPDVEDPFGLGKQLLREVPLCI